MNAQFTGKLFGPIILALVLLMLAPGELPDRDQRRIDRAQENHEAELERAWDQFLNRVERANRGLMRSYEQVINQYERRGDTARARQLQQELDELGDLREIVSRLADIDLSDDDDDEDSDANAPGDAHSRLIEAIGPALVFGNGRVVETKGLAGAEYVVLYFSAGWCGPCRIFTPRLIEFYQQNGGGERFEIVFVSSDRSPSDFVGYFRDSNMPWPAIPYEHVDASGIKKAFGRSAYPHVVVLDGEGDMALSSHNQSCNAVLTEFAAKLQQSEN